MPKQKQIISMSAEVAIQAAAGEGEHKGPPTFSVVAYTGGAMTLGGWDLPVVVDLEGMSFGKSLVANLDHDSSKRVGNVNAKEIVDNQLVLSGTASAATESRREVVESAADGFVWQASIEASPDEITEVAAGKTTNVNGRDFQGPLYVASKSTLKGFGFVSHGADDNTTVSIAATAETITPKEKTMAISAELNTFIESIGLSAEALDADQLAAIEANYKGLPTPAKKIEAAGLSGFEAKKAENTRQSEITDYALRACDSQPYNIDSIKLLTEQAIEAKWSLDKFRLELLEASAPGGNMIVTAQRDKGMSNRVLEAAICQAGRLKDHEGMFRDHELQAAHDRFKGRIGLNQLILLAAQSNGYRSEYASQITVEAQRAAFGVSSPQSIRASGFSNISIATILSNVANKFLRQGWDAVDMTPMRIAAIRNVSNFLAITTTSLIADVEFEKVGSDGQIKHGDLSELTYTNKADTYARMLAITRTDMINDNLGALTVAPAKLGRGGALKLNNIFWTAFLNNSSFFTTGRGNANEGVATMTTAGLSATETLFANQTDPNGDPLGMEASILLVPTAHKSAASTLMNSERLIDGTGTAAQGDSNVWRDRFTVESSPYMSNSNYTGYSAEAWYLLADPSVLPVIEIAALYGNVMPVIESADAEFNTLGVQMRGYSDVGVTKQEYRGGVRADGGAS